MATQSGLKLIFAGTPEFAARHLAALISSPHTIVSVYTQPDRPAGRGKALHASAVKNLAVTAGIPVEQPSTLKDPSTHLRLQSYQADLMVVVAYGLLLPSAVLKIPRLGCINVHASLLPRWRGAAPIQRALQAGDAETGISIMQMEAGLDTGPVLLTRACPILPSDTAAHLHDRLADLGAVALLDSLDLIARQKADTKPQNHSLATYAHKLTKEEAALDWAKPVVELERQVRAFNPFPIAFTGLGGEQLRVYQAEIVPVRHQKPPGTLLSTDGELVVACAGDSALRLLTVQMPGKKVLAAKDLLNGAAGKFKVGMVLDAR